MDVFWGDVYVCACVVGGPQQLTATHRLVLHKRRLNALLAAILVQNDGDPVAVLLPQDVTNQRRLQCSAVQRGAEAVAGCMRLTVYCVLCTVCLYTHSFIHSFIRLHLTLPEPR
jgi:hypothetical protein